MFDALLVIAAYLLGAIPFGYLLVKWVKGVDVRKLGSGNIGMTNVWRVAGAGWGIATFVLDVSKGVAAVWLAGHFDPGDDLLKVICGLAALLGNVFSVFLKFTGGKGIGISTGIFFYLLPLESSAGLASFILALLLTRMISVGSLLGVSVMMALTLHNTGLNWFSALAMAGTVTTWWTHRENIKRILKGTENRVGIKKK